MKALFLFTLLFATMAHATDIQDLQAPALPTTDYYSLREPTKPSENTSFQAPLAVLQDATQTLMRTTMSLLDWVLKKNMPLPAEAYQRTLQFGHWINDPSDDSCMNTRAKVLVRDSEGEVTFKNEHNCAVTGGHWADPYAGAELTDSKEIQIDHVVPLKHAYVAGAWKWDYNTRCLYANFLGTNYNLMSVSGHENMSKGDKSPEKYMPPSQAYRCEYLKIWLKIKATWRLAISLPEAEAIQQLMKDNDCSSSSMVMGLNEIRDLRIYIKNNLNYCVLNKR